LVGVKKIVKVFKELGCKIVESNVNMQETISPWPIISDNELEHYLQKKIVRGRKMLKNVEVNKERDLAKVLWA